MLQPGAAAQDGLVMRGLHTAIVDEADSALIDEAVTPLLISREQQNEPLRQACATAHTLAMLLTPGADYSIDAQHQEIVLLPPGHAKLAARAAELPGMWRGAQRRAELVTQALRAREFFHLGKQYVIEDGKVVIVDEFTGRLMHQRTWREGLHQAVEAKEGLAVSAPSETLARLSFQRFFRMYQRLSGLSGTVWEAAPEVWQIYRLPVVRIPTNKPCQRLELPDRIFASAEEKWSAVVEEISARHARRQPVLVGTRSVAASERLARMLEGAGLPAALLNATRHQEEAAIIAQAGEQGRITIATNMAGRGTDIQLGPLVAEIGGLHVILTERHESRRIDRQLMGRAARQGDPGSAQAFVSLEDELPARHALAWLRERIRAALAARAPGAALFAQRLINRAQRRAERQAYLQRRRVLEMDTWIEDALAFAGAELHG
jgi:preprotein translocase subunit SecA